MKRKLLSLLVVCALFALALTLTGCGEKQTQEEQPEQNAEEQTQEADVNEIYKQYILEKQYKDETADWDSEVDEYSILDLDQDGTEELVLKSGDMDFYYILICGYNKEKQEVVVISNLGSTYGGFRYIEGSNKITYTDFRPFNDAMSYGFYKIENNELVNTGSAGQDMGQYFIEEQGNKRNSTEDEVRSLFDNAKYPEYQKISSLKETSTETASGDDVIQAGSYTLQYGKYKDKYGTVYTLNSDGTYTCESTQTGDQYSKSGTYIIYNYNDYEKEIEEYEEQNGGAPIGFSGEWMIAFNYNNKDSSKPYLLYSYNIEDNNTFYNGQTDEIWTYQGS